MEHSILQNRINPDVVTHAVEHGALFQHAEPFKHVVIDDFFTDGFCQNLVTEFPPFDEELAMNEDGIVGAKAVFEKIRSIGPAYADLDELVRTGEFRSLVTDITGIPDLCHDPYYFGGGTHENREGQGLDAHVDFNYHPVTRQHRRINLIVYLNPEWRDEWGGSLQLHRDPYLPPSHDDIHVVTPLLNRCVIFETNEYSWHGFPTIRLPQEKQGISRRSFALYYYTDTRPQEDTGPEHSTIYVEEHLPESLHAGMTLDADLLEHIHVLVSRRDTHLKRLYGNIKELNTEIHGLRYQLEELNSAPKEAQNDKTEELNTEIQGLRNQLEELYSAQKEAPGDVMEELNTRITDLKNQVLEFETSTSWRITAPVRALKRLITRQ
jgi:hypothetical protein